MMKKSCAWLLFLGLISSQSAFALRCGSYGINEGMFKGEVFGKCGRPASVASHIERRSNGNSVFNQQYYGNQRQIYPNSSFGFGQNYSVETEVVIEEWIYNFGSSRIQQYLRFENGVLKEVRNLGRGY
jgi:hypothetical protein